MRHGREVRRVCEELHRRLDGGRVGLSDAATYFTCPPLDTPAVFGGVRLADAMVPGCLTAPATLAEMWTTLMWWINDGAPEDAKRYILPTIGGRVAKVVGYSPERFLLWAGKHADNRLAAGPDMLMIEGECTYGLADGKAYTTAQPFDYAYNAAAISAPTEHKTRDPGFRALWVRAKELGDEEAKVALGALKATSATKFLVLMPWLRLGVGSADTIGTLLQTSTDPVADVYRHLVPRVMDSKEFEKRVAKLDSRPLNPDAGYREKLWARMRKNGLI